MASAFHGKPVYFKDTSRVLAALRISVRKASIPGTPMVES